MGGGPAWILCPHKHSASVRLCCCLREWLGALTCHACGKTRVHRWQESAGPEFLQAVRSQQFFKMFVTSFILCVCIQERVCHSTHVGVRGQLEKVYSLLSPYRSWGLNSGDQVWQQAPFPAEPAHWPKPANLEALHMAPLLV